MSLWRFKKKSLADKHLEAEELEDEELETPKRVKTQEKVEKLTAKKSSKHGKAKK